MLNLGGGELLLLLILGLLLFGPRKLPEIGRTFGKAMREFRNATQNLQTGIEREVHLEEIRKTGNELTNVGNEVRQDLQRVARGASGLVGTCEEQAANAPEGASAARQESSSEPAPAASGSDAHAKSADPSRSES